MNGQRTVLTLLIGCMISAGLSADPQPGEIKKPRASRLELWTLGESLLLLNAAGARLSPTVMGVTYLVGLALGPPNGNSKAAKATHYGSYLALSTYDFYAEQHVPHRRMFWRQLAFIHVAVFAPLVVDRLLGIRSTDDEANTWDVGLALAPSGIQVNTQLRFGRKSSKEANG